MNEKIVPVVVESTGEVVGTANVSPPDENGKCYANINITNTKLLEQHNGLVEVVLSHEFDFLGEEDEERESS